MAGSPSERSRSTPWRPTSPSQFSALRTSSRSAATPFSSAAPAYPYPTDSANPTKIGIKASSGSRVFRK
eukprot:10688689-Heterocapsa_arctica.AAC.1